MKDINYNAKAVFNMLSPNGYANIERVTTGSPGLFIPREAFDALIAERGPIDGPNYFSNRPNSYFIDNGLYEQDILGTPYYNDRGQLIYSLERDRAFPESDLYNVKHQNSNTTSFSGASGTSYESNTIDVYPISGATTDRNNNNLDVMSVSDYDLAGNPISSANNYDPVDQLTLHNYLPGGYHNNTVAYAPIEYAPIEHAPIEHAPPVDPETRAEIIRHTVQEPLEYSDYVDLFEDRPQDAVGNSANSNTCNGIVQNAVDLIGSLFQG